MLKRLLPKPSLIRRDANGTLAIVEGYWRDEKHKDTGLPCPRQNLLLWPFFIRFQFKLKKVKSVASMGLPTRVTRKTTKAELCQLIREFMDNTPPVDNSPAGTQH